MNSSFQHIPLNKPDILAVIEREGIELKQRGRDYWIKHHGEKTASCKISPERQTFYCFGCGSHGDIIDFISELHGQNFKDACRYLHITSGKPAPVDPTIQRRKKIQQNYNEKITALYDSLCQQSRELHKLKLRVKQNPRILTDTGSILFAHRMGILAAIDYKIDVLLNGDFEDHIELLKEIKGNDNENTNRRAA
jgi:DNA primase